MRPTIPLAVALLLALAGPAAADSTTGNGDNTFIGTGGPVQLAVSAHGTGTAVKGNVESSGNLGIGDFWQAGPVTCQRVVGNEAAIKYRVDHATGSGAPPLGTVVEVFIQDNGPPGHGVPDANATREPEFPPLGQLDAGNCDDPSLQPEWNPIDTGNYVVRAG
jgi:hypothetical protein